MAVNDIQQVGAATFGPNGSVTHVVALGATEIFVGDPIVATLGATSVAVMATNSPVVSTHYVVGIATSAGSQTATAAGKVSVQPIIPGQIWSIAPKVAATWNTQAEYDALVGARVLIDLTAGVYTILAADSSANGCVVLWKDVNIDTGKIYFAFRNGVSNLS